MKTREDFVYADKSGVYALEHGGKNKLSETMRLLIATWICLEQLEEEHPKYFKGLFDGMNVKDAKTGMTLKQIVYKHIKEANKPPTLREVVEAMEITDIPDELTGPWDTAIAAAKKIIRKSTLKKREYK